MQYMDVIKIEIKIKMDKYNNKNSLFRMSVVLLFCVFCAVQCVCFCTGNFVRIPIFTK